MKHLSQLILPLTFLSLAQNSQAQSLSEFEKLKDNIINKNSTQNCHSLEFKSKKSWHILSYCENRDILCLYSELPGKKQVLIPLNPSNKDTLKKYKNFVAYINKSYLKGK